MTTDTVETTEVATPPTPKHGSLPDHAAFFAPVREFETIHQNATDHVYRLQVEAAALPQMKEESILNGDAKGYQHAVTRLAELGPEIMMGRIAQAKALAKLCEVRKDTAVAYLQAVSDYGFAIGGEAGYPIGVQKAGEAVQAHENARSIRFSASAALADANRALLEVLEEARKAL